MPNATASLLFGIVEWFQNFKNVLILKLLLLLPLCFGGLAMDVDSTTSPKTQVIFSSFIHSAPLNLLTHSIPGKTLFSKWSQTSSSLIPGSWRVRMRLLSQVSKKILCVVQFDSSSQAMTVLEIILFCYIYTLSCEECYQVVFIKQQKKNHSAQ